MTDDHGGAIRIDDLLMARRRCTMAAFPSWIGRWPAAIFAVMSVFFGILSFAGHAATALAVFAGHRFMLDGRAIGGVLQLAGIGAMTVEFFLMMRHLRDVAFATSPSAPSSPGLWLFVGPVAAFLAWGVIATIRCQQIAARCRLAAPSGGRYRRLWRRVRALGFGRVRQVSLAALWAALAIMPALIVSALLIRRLEGTVARYSRGVLALGFLAYAVLMHQSGKWGQRFIFKARRLSALRADEILRIDARPPSLLLRSFADDLLPLAPRYRLGQDYPFTTVFLTAEQLTLEEVVADALSDFGPVIAIGKPGEPLPPVGAARDYLANVKWQDSVAEHMQRARWIVIVLGKTEGLGVEWSMVRQLGQLAKVIIVFPPVGVRDLETRWAGLTADAIGKTSSGDLDEALVAIFRDGRHPTFISCAERDEQCYELALQSALGLAMPF